MGVGHEENEKKTDSGKVAENAQVSECIPIYPT